jgi:hypothetical protein
VVIAFTSVKAQRRTQELSFLEGQPTRITAVPWRTSPRAQDYFPLPRGARLRASTALGEVGAA